MKPIKVLIHWYLGNGLGIDSTQFESAIDEFKKEA